MLAHLTRRLLAGLLAVLPDGQPAQFDHRMESQMAINSCWSLHRALLAALL